MKLLFLTEGTRITGYGHVSRIKSLLQAATSLNLATKVIGNFDSTALEMLSSFDPVDYPWTSEIVAYQSEFSNADIVIIDSYEANTATYQKIKNIIQDQCILIVVDDFARIDYPEGVILNYSIGAQKKLYQNQTGAKKYFLGPKYALLSNLFWNCRRFNVNIREIATNITINFGGVDKNNFGRMTFQSLKKEFPEFNFHVISASDQFHDEVDLNIKISKFVSQEELIKSIQQADIFISASGHTTYEIAALGTPMIAVLSAENQKINHIGWANYGIPTADATSANYAELIQHAVRRLLPAEVRHKLSKKLRKLVNFEGSISFLKAIGV